MTRGVTMQDHFDVSRHEAGHALSCWLQGGRVKTIVAARSGFHNDGIPDGCLGICGGEFRDSSLVMNEPAKIIAEKMLAVLFAGGIADGNPNSTFGDMGMAILSMGWPAKKYPEAGRDAFDLVEKHGQDIPIEERIGFFKKHSQTFWELIQNDDAQAAITALTDALNKAPGHMVRGGEAAEIFEKVYDGEIPDGVLPLDYHGELSDKLLSPERTIDDCAFYLNFCLKRLDDADIDERVERARVAVIQALLQVSALI